MSARSLMVMGTASDAGKSVVVTALCRVFARAGVRVVPFKSQNMSNNAAVCPGGGEIGRAQAVQAEACGLKPTVDMNPVLLKPETETGCQVVIRGQARFHMRAHEHQRWRQQSLTLWRSGDRNTTGLPTYWKRTRISLASPHMQAANRSVDDIRQHVRERK